MTAAALLLLAAAAAAPELPREAPADALNYSRRIWQSADGLPEDFAQALAQTPDGYLWIGTSAGLVRFDGVRFVVFDRAGEPAFHDDSVYSLLAARDGALWAGTEGGGLLRYRAGVFRAFGPADGLTNGFVRVIYQDRAGRLWVGTDRGLFRVEGDRLLRIDNRAGLPSINVHSIWEDRRGRLLVGGSGILVLDGAAPVYYRSPGTFADNSVRAIRQTADGSLWIGTISGLRRISEDYRGDPFLAPLLIAGVNISVIREDRGGSVWIGTYGNGLLRFQDGRMIRLAAPAAVPHNNVLAVFADREGDVWVGTQGGLLRLSPSAARTITTPDGVPQSINTIYDDPRGPLLVAALNGRLFRVADSSLVPAPLPPLLSSVPIRNAFRDREGALWIGTDGQGAVRFRGSAVFRYTMRDGLVNDFVRAFCQDRDGAIWIGTDGGLSRWQDGRFENFGVESGLAYESVRALLPARDGALWVATDGGLNRIRSRQVVAEPALDRLGGQKVWALYEDSGGGLWIGTHGAGLFLFKAGRLSSFNLPTRKIHFIAEDPEGHLWMSGPTGVISVARRELEESSRSGAAQPAVRVYSTAEGLSTNQMNGGVQPAGALTATGALWVPSTKGVVRIERGSPDSAGAPPILIERVLADDRPVPLTSALRLAPGRGKLEIQYTAVRLRSPERLRFRYFLERFDHDWTEAGERRAAYYTNVPPGSYRFHVVAYELNDPRQTAEQVLDLEWRPHFYQTSWFLSLCALAALASIWGAYRLHVRGVRQRFAAVLAERNRLAREMHDTLIQGCIGVSALLEAASTAHGVSPDMGRDLLDRARSEIRSTVDEARLAVWNLRQGDGDDLVGAISRLALLIAGETGIPVQFKSAGAPLPLGVEAAHSVLLVVREAVQNAVRHAAPKTVAITLSFERRGLEVEIVDDGRGFDPAAASSSAGPHYGLVGMRERVERLGGAFHLDTAPAAGTRVRFRLPLAGRPLRTGDPLA